jgi:predicted flap endonuclease-1-like 5' DNA nuclease
MASLIKIEGIGTANAQKLARAGIRTTTTLLARGAAPQGRLEIAQQTGFNPKTILEWVNRADLFRIRGVGEEYSDLLERAGVDTVVELAQRNAEQLHAKMAQANQKDGLVRQLPALSRVKDWVKQAKRLRRVVTY